MVTASLLHRRADVGKSAREFFRFESASVRGRAHRRDLTRICLIAETSPALSFAAWRTTMRGHTHRLRGSVVVGLSPHLRANGLRPRADCLSSRQVSLGRLGCKWVTRAADIQIHSGLRGAGSLTRVNSSQEPARGHSKSFEAFPSVIVHATKHDTRAKQDVVHAGQEYDCVGRSIS